MIMAVYDKSRFYWIKLTDRFMTSDTVDFLMSQKGGANYIVLYQMLCLKTVNNNGVLARTLNEILIPFDAEKIQRDCKWFTIDTVHIALDLYKKLGLIYENADGMFAITDFDRMIGSQSEGSLKKQEQRSRAKEVIIFEGGQKGGQKVDNCPPDKDKDKDKNTTTTTNNIFIDSASANILESEEQSDIENRVYDLFEKRGFISSPDDFITYNNARDWKGIGGEDVKKQLVHYANKWELSECIRRGIAPSEDLLT